MSGSSTCFTETEKPRIYLPVLCVMLLATVVAALLLGSTHITLSETVKAFTGGGDETLRIIIFRIRLPRILAGILAGIGLSVAGVLLQSVTGNELASPGIIGVNSGAGFMVILILSIAPGMVSCLPLAAFLGACGATALILSVANRVGTSKSNVILAGIAVTTALNAAISLLSLLDEDVLAIYNSFSIGSLSGVAIERLIIPAILIFTSLIVSLLLSGKISILCLGSDMASSLGVHVKRLNIVCLVCACASAAAVVSFAGLLGFVGLVVPHLSRRLVGNGTRTLLCVSALFGSILTVWADLLGRILFAPSELSVGIVMALIGAPFFFYLLLRRSKRYA